MKKGCMNKLENTTPSVTLKPTLILHTGGPKCGSSALQTFLTKNPKIESLGGKTIEYWTVSNSGSGNSDLNFRQIYSQEQKTFAGYQSSGHLTKEFKENCIHKIFDKFMLKHLKEVNNIFVFSCEGWAQDIQIENVGKCLCENRDFNIYVYQSIRPQIDILIPSYLQWNVWTQNPSLSECFRNLIGFAAWDKQIRSAYTLGADKVYVRFSSDIVKDFCEIFEVNQNSIKWPPNARINKSLPIEAIVFLLRNRQLRVNPHDSSIDFLIEYYLEKSDFHSENIPLKVDNELIFEIVDYFKKGNSNLSKFMDPEQFKVFQSTILTSKNRMLQESGFEEIVSAPLSIDFIEKLLVALLVSLKETNL